MTTRALRLEQQELYGQLVEAQLGALWTVEDIKYVTSAPDLVRIVVGVDPAGTTHHTEAQTGIVVMGLAEDGKCYVLADLSGWHEPEVWAQIVVDACKERGARPVVETNYGGELVLAALRTQDRSVAAQTITVTATRASTCRPSRWPPCTSGPRSSTSACSPTWSRR